MIPVELVIELIRDRDKRECVMSEVFVYKMRE